MKQRAQVGVFQRFMVGIWQQNSSSFFYKNSVRKSRQLQSRSQKYFGHGTKPSTRSSVDLCLTLRQFCASLSLHQTSFSLNTIHSSSIHALTVLNKVRPQSLKMILWLNQGGYLFCPPPACLSTAAALDFHAPLAHWDLLQTFWIQYIKCTHFALLCLLQFSKKKVQSFRNGLIQVCSVAWV